jgi:hypothetical protein
MEVHYGVCRLSIVSVRKEPTHLSAQITQLLFGDHYQVMAESEDKKWLYIQIHFDQSRGWIHSKQHHFITKEYYDQINTVDFKITTDVCATILYKKVPLSIVIGSVVPISQSELFRMEEQFAFNGEAKSIAQKRDVEFLCAVAMSYLNAPEQEGGRTAFGIDGAGLVQSIYRLAGYTLVRDFFKWPSLYQATSLPQKGDIVILRQGDIKSVGCMVDRDKVIHVDGKVRIDLKNGDGLYNSETNTISHRIESSIRVLTS